MHSFTSLNSSVDQDEPAIPIVKKRNRFAMLVFLSRKKSNRFDNVGIGREQGYFPSEPLCKQQYQSNVDLDSIDSVSVNSSNKIVPMLDLSFDGKFDLSNEMSPEEISSTKNVPVLDVSFNGKFDPSTEISPQETLKDIQKFEENTPILPSVKSELKRTLFTEVSGEPITPPKLFKVASCDEEDFNSTPKIKNIGLEIPEDRKSPAVITVLPKPSALPSLDELIGAAKDVVKLSKDAVNIFNISNDSNDSETKTETPTSKDTGDLQADPMNGAKVVKRPLKVGANVYSDSETNIEMLLKTPIRGERRTTLIVGKSQSIITAIATPKKPEVFSKVLVFDKPSPIDDIFDDLDDSPDRAIRFSNCNFQVITKNQHSSTTIGFVFNPFEDSISEEDLDIVKEDCEECKRNLDNEKVGSDFVKDVESNDVWFSFQNQKDAFSPIDWAMKSSAQKHLTSNGSCDDSPAKVITSPEDLLKKIEDAKAIIAALKGLAITKANEKKEIHNDKKSNYSDTKNHLLLPQRALHNIANESKDGLDMVSIRQISPLYNIESSAAVTESVTPSDDCKKVLFHSPTIQDILPQTQKHNFVSPDGVTRFPNSDCTTSNDDTSDFDIKQNKTTIVCRNILMDVNDSTPKDPRRTISIKERIKFFELQQKK